MRWGFLMRVTWIKGALIYSDGKFCFNSKSIW